MEKHNCGEVDCLGVDKLVRGVNRSFATVGLFLCVILTLAGIYDYKTLFATGVLDTQATDISATSEDSDYDERSVSDVFVPFHARAAKQDTDTVSLFVTDDCNSDVLSCASTAVPVALYASNDVRYDLTSDEGYMLQKIAMAEAEDQDTEGKALVILVVMNRVNSDGFPDDIWSVITQKGQFESYENGRYDRVIPDEDCADALELVESGWDSSEGALFFEITPKGGSWQSHNLTRLFKHQAHTFYI